MPTSEKSPNAKPAKDNSIQEYRFILRDKTGREINIIIESPSKKEADLKVKEILGSLTGKFKVIEKE